MTTGLAQPRPPAPAPAPTGQAIPAAEPGLTERVRTLPWRVWVVAAGAGFGIWWYMTRPADPVVSWESRARVLLTEDGYPPDDINSALQHYLHSGVMTPTDVAIIAVAIRRLGLPPSPSDGAAPASSGSSVDGGPPTAGGGGPGSGADMPPAQGYWYVVAAPVGWSATFRGIAQQFYGDGTRGSYLMQVNPDVRVASAHAQIPTGTRVRVPRSLTV